MFIQDRIREWKINNEIGKINIDNVPVFSQIEIETVNRCNGECSFCPVNRNAKQREYAKMKDELFYKIIDDLKRMSYASSICFSSNNEPFIDNRMEKFIVYTREQLPDADLYLWTNGTVANVQTIENILPAIDRIYIDNYSDNGKLHKNVERIYDAISKKQSGLVKIYNGLVLPADAKVAIFNRDINAVMSTRGGQAPNKNSINKPLYRKCRRIFDCMVVRPTGDVSLCCCDALGIYTMGNVNEESIDVIWKKSLEYHRVRQIMQKKGRKGLTLCDKCDF